MIFSFFARLIPQTKLGVFSLWAAGGLAYVTTYNGIRMHKENIGQQAALAEFLSHVSAIETRIKKGEKVLPSETEGVFTAFQENPAWNYKKHDDIMEKKWSEINRLSK